MTFSEIVVEHIHPLPNARLPYSASMLTHAEDAVIDWAQCTLVEINPRKVSGVPILKGTRVQADAIVENYEDGSPIKEIAENFAIPESTIRAILDFAAIHPQP